MPTTTWGEIVTPAGSDAYDIPADMLAMAESLQLGVVGAFDSVADRDTAYASLDSGSRVAAWVDDDGLYMHNGTRWLCIAGATPIEYISSMGTSSNLNTHGDWFTYPSGGSYTFTPTRSGWADIYYDVKAASITTGFDSAAIRGVLNGVTTDAVEVIHQDTPVKWGRYRSVQRRMLYEGVSTTIYLQVLNSVDGGEWQILSLTWHLVQQ